MATQNKLQKLEVTVGQGFEVIDLSENEVLEYETFVLECQQIVADKLAQIATRESALSKLAALGLTEEEIAAL